MSDGVLVADALVWEPYRGTWWRERCYRATCGECDALVFLGDSDSLPWRGMVRHMGKPEERHRVLCYRTAEAAKLATGERLRKVAEQ